MSLTTIVVELAWIAATVILCARAHTAHRTDRLRTIYAITAMTNFGVAAAWLLAAAVRGDSPGFGLWPLLVAGVLTGLMALRANQLHTRLQGTAPH